MIKITNLSVRINNYFLQMLSIYINVIVNLIDVVEMKNSCPFSSYVQVLSSRPKWKYNPFLVEIQLYMKVDENIVIWS